MRSSARKSGNALPLRGLHTVPEQWNEELRSQRSSGSNTSRGQYHDPDGIANANTSASVQSSLSQKSAQSGSSRGRHSKAIPRSSNHANSNSNSSTSATRSSSRPSQDPVSSQERVRRRHRDDAYQRELIYDDHDRPTQPSSFYREQHGRAHPKNDIRQQRRVEPQSDASRRHSNRPSYHRPPPPPIPQQYAAQQEPPLPPRRRSKLEDYHYHYPANEEPIMRQPQRHSDVARHADYFHHDSHQVPRRISSSSVASSTRGQYEYDQRMSSHIGRDRPAPPLLHPRSIASNTIRASRYAAETRNRPPRRDFHRHYNDHDYCDYDDPYYYDEERRLTGSDYHPDYYYQEELLPPPPSDLPPPLEERVYVDASGRPYRVVAPVEPRRRLYRPGTSVNHSHLLRSAIPPPPPSTSYYSSRQQQRLGTTSLVNNRQEPIRTSRQYPSHPSSPYYYDMNERRRASSGQPRQRRYHPGYCSEEHEGYDEGDIPSHRHSRPSESRRSTDNGENRQKGRHSAQQHATSESAWSSQPAAEIVKEESLTRFIGTGGGDTQKGTPKTAKTKSINNGSDQIVAEDDDILVLEEEDNEEELDVGGDEHLFPTPIQRGRGPLRRRHSIGSAHSRSSLLEEIGAAHEQAERLARYSTDKRGAAPLATSNRRRTVQGRLESSSHVMIDQAPLAPLHEQARRRGPGHDFFEDSFGHLAYREDRRRMRSNNSSNNGRPLRRSNSDPSLDTDLGSFADYYVNVFDGGGGGDDDDDDDDDDDTPSVSMRPVGFIEEDRSYYNGDDQSRDYSYHRYNGRQGGYPPPSSGRPRVQRRHSFGSMSERTMDRSFMDESFTSFF